MFDVLAENPLLHYEHDYSVAQERNLVKLRGRNGSARNGWNGDGKQGRGVAAENMEISGDITTVRIDFER